MALNKNFGSGSTSMLVLRLLQDEDLYGYEIIDKLQKKSNNIFALKAGTLYPLLHLLEEQQFLTSYEKEVGGKIRKYYQITKSGKKHLALRREEWEAYSEAIKNVLSMEGC